MQINGFKGFDKDMKCRDFQFKEGETFIHDGNVSACNSGFHFCTNPLDVFNYYSPGQSVFHEVVGSGKTDDHDDDSKVACEKIKIGVRLSLHDVITAGVKFMFEREYKVCTSSHVKKNRSASSATGDSSASSTTGYSSASSTTGYRSASSATGDSSASSTTGYRSASSATGDSSASSTTGDSSASSTTGYRSASSATGYSSASSTTGDRSASSTTGDRSASSTTGDRSASSTTGDRSASSATGDASAAVCTGTNSKAMSGKYGVIALSFYNGKEDRFEMRCAETGCGDGSDGKLKAECWYCLNEYGEFIELEGG